MMLDAAFVLTGILRALLVATCLAVRLGLT